MNLLVKGKNVDISNRVHDYAEKRLSKVAAFLNDDVTRLELEVTEEKNPRVSEGHVAEVTLWTKGPTIRAKEAAHDVFAAIDKVADKLMRQVRKLHDRRSEYRTGKGHHPADIYKGAPHANGNGFGVLNASLNSEEGDSTMAATDERRIVKTKQFGLGPMSPEDAAEQMELIGHDFFLFVNGENNQTCVLYKRADGAYGLIEPTFAEAEAS